MKTQKNFEIKKHISKFYFYIILLLENYFVYTLILINNNLKADFWAKTSEGKNFWCKLSFAVLIAAKFFSDQWLRTMMRATIHEAISMTAPTSASRDTTAYSPLPTVIATPASYFDIQLPRGLPPTCWSFQHVIIGISLGRINKFCHSLRRAIQVRLEALGLN